MKRPTWRVREDIKHEYKDDEGNVEATTYTQGDPYTRKMTDADWKIYQGATIIGVLMLVACVVVGLGLVVS